MSKVIETTKESSADIQALEALQNLANSYKKYKLEIGERICLAEIIDENHVFYTLIKEELYLSRYGLRQNRETQGPRTITEKCSEPFTNSSSYKIEKVQMWQVKMFKITKKGLEKALKEGKVKFY